MVMTKLGLKLLELRQSHNLTQEQLSNDLNVSRVSYSHFERGERVPDITFMLQLANYYRIDISQLINNDLIPLHVITNTKGKKPKINDADNEYLADEIYRFIKQKNLLPNDVLQLTKSDIDIIAKFRSLPIDDQQELVHILKYKINRLSKK